MIGVHSNLGWQVERYRQPRGSMAEQVLVTFVGFLGVAHAGVLTHGPKATAVHSRLHAAGKRELPGIADLLVVIPPLEISRRVQRADGNVGQGFLLVAETG